MSEELPPHKQMSDTLLSTLDQVWRDMDECDEKWQEYFGRDAPDPFLDPAMGGDMKLYREAVALDKRIVVTDCLHSETVDAVETLFLDKKWYEMENEHLEYALECALKGNTALAVAHRDQAAKIKETRVSRLVEAAAWWKGRRDRLLKAVEEREKERQMEWRVGGGETERETAEREADESRWYRTPSNRTHINPLVLVDSWVSMDQNGSFAALLNLESILAGVGELGFVNGT
ncbi:hypothetical protein KIPB_004308 [Kipferlia bialata]|uniref:Uncharacterized protein n=1 Tax=Kipferlia bialata TaxID=797122 RepID=A0A9K3CV93_9EUKA|nr:hypothetical protein KIPB_004308 [Kipferlia bialata]|eukprot:g4308.t1